MSQGYGQYWAPGPHSDVGLSRNRHAAAALSNMSDPFLFETHTAIFATEDHSNTSGTDRHRALNDTALQLFCREENKRQHSLVRAALGITDERNVYQPCRNASKPYANAACSDFDTQDATGRI